MQSEQDTLASPKATDEPEAWSVKTYLRDSRSLLNCIVLVLPLFVIYQLGVLTTNGVQNGVDFVTTFLLHRLFDGNTLYYWTPGPRGANKQFLAARIERGPPFAVTSIDTVLSGAYSAASDLHPEGARLIISQNLDAAGGTEAPVAAEEPERFLMVTNWFEELRQRLGN